MRYYTSDHHFGHARIVGLSARPFVDVDEMNETLIARWNSTVSDNDTVWILGDIAMGGYLRTLETCVSRLSGHKILVPGNHDRCWQGHERVTDAHIAAYVEIGGIAEIVNNPEPHIIDGTTVRVSHFPYAMPGSGQRYEQRRPVDDGSWLLCGHVHEHWRQNRRQINVGVDAWDFAPVPETAIAALIGEGENWVPSREDAPADYATTH